ncbi:alanine racemase [Lentilactobacillus laojiaonis]|uniref:alanine racemase n=1 Tax=Lentilactobacillus laojiaonis TaxID=2883998 RepID=UPI001D09CF0C|nr:alanine racemase [Lentilactobacillus laojiaonis]UDM31923.1 alanine racemase [Lentilactobacillus laojiaonis]
MTVGNHRPAQIVIDQKALYENISNAKKHLQPNTNLFMVVKADGYGHGAVQVARVAQQAGADGFCVSILDEALQLRQAGIVDVPILVLGIIDPLDAMVAAENQISVTVGSIEWLQRAEQVLSDLPNESPILNIHFGLDTGMGRIGFQKPSELKDAINYLESNNNHFNFEGIFTHFSTADSSNTDYFEIQKQRFKEFMEVVDKKPKYVHVANSATSLWHQYGQTNIVRLGIAGYGLNPSGREIADLPYQLKPAMSFTSKLVYTKYVEKGRSIGYGATYETDEDQWIGTVPVGYADGYSRNMQGYYVLVDGQKCPVVGRVCMDQFMIRLPKKYDVNTPVTLMGTSGNETITADDIADHLGTISYEIICGFSVRLPRKYI